MDILTLLNNSAPEMAGGLGTAAVLALVNKAKSWFPNSKSIDKVQYEDLLQKDAEFEKVIKELANEIAKNQTESNIGIYATSGTPVSVYGINAGKINTVIQKVEPK